MIIQSLYGDTIVNISKTNHEHKHTLTQTCLTLHQAIMCLIFPLHNSSPAFKIQCRFPVSGTDSGPVFPYQAAVYRTVADNISTWKENENMENLKIKHKGNVISARRDEYFGRQEEKEDVNEDGNGAHKLLY